MDYDEFFDDEYHCDECGEDFEDAKAFFDHLGHGNVCPVVIGSD